MKEITITKEDFYDTYDTTVRIYDCPVCANRVERGDYYFPNCGSKIKWNLKK